MLYQKKKMISETIKPAILLNIEVIAQAGALNAQDEFASRVLELQMAGIFLQRVVEESAPLVKGSTDWYRSPFSRYVRKYGHMTQERYEDLRIGETSIYYTSPLITEDNVDLRSVEQKRDKDFCVAAYLFMSTLLSFSPDIIDATYIGFESGGFCWYPSTNDRFLHPGVQREGWKCERSQTGYYTPVCRPWYKLQQANPYRATVGDTYQYADGDKFGITFCVPINLQGEFNSALCFDIKIIQEALPFLDDQTLSYKLQSTPLILQHTKDSFVTFLETLIVGEKSDFKVPLDFKTRYELEELSSSWLFKDVRMKTGKFDMPENATLDVVGDL